MTIFIPWTKYYWITLLLHFIQGCLQSIFDLCSNESVLRLWHGVSNSPVSVSLAGYGIGALASVFIAKPYVKFNPILNADIVINADKIDNNQTNRNESIQFINENVSSVNATSQSSKITLYVPYSIFAVYGFLIGLFFLITHFYEIKNKLVFNQESSADQSVKLKVIIPNDSDIMLLKSQSSLVNDGGNVFKKLLIQIFGEKPKYLRETNTGKILKAVLLAALSFTIGGYTVMLSNFMLTYLTTGPAKIHIKKYFAFQMIFWLFHVISRLFTSIIAFKMNSLKYFTVLILLNFAASIVYTLPAVNSVESFYWFIIACLAFLSASLLPSCYMIIKHIMKNVNTILLAFFSLAFAIGAILFNVLVGHLLDTFVPHLNWLGYENPSSSYIIPFMILTSISLALFIYFLLIFVYFRFKTKAVVVRL